MIITSSYIIKQCVCDVLTLTQHVDEGVGQQVSVLVGGVTLVNGAGARLDLGEDDGVVLHLPAGVFRSVCQQQHSVS